MSSYVFPPLSILNPRFYNYSPMTELDNFSCEPTDEMEDEAARGPATEHGAKLHIIFRVNINNIDLPRCDSVS